MPGVSLIPADVLLFYWLIDYGWQLSQIKRVNQTIATQEILDHMGVGTCPVIYLTIGSPCIGITPTDNRLVGWQIFGRWQYIQLQDMLYTVTIHICELLAMRIGTLTCQLLSIPCVW